LLAIHALARIFLPLPHIKRNKDNKYTEVPAFIPDRSFEMDRENQQVKALGLAASLSLTEPVIRIDKFLKVLDGNDFCDDQDKNIIKKHFEGEAKELISTLRSRISD
jgi:hypothetical protein